MSRNTCAPVTVMSHPSARTTSVCAGGVRVRGAPVRLPRSRHEAPACAPLCRDRTASSIEHRRLCVYVCVCDQCVETSVTTQVQKQNQKRPVSHYGVFVVTLDYGVFPGRAGRHGSEAAIFPSLRRARRACTADAGVLLTHQDLGRSCSEPRSASSASGSTRSAVCVNGAPVAFPWSHRSQCSMIFARATTEAEQGAFLMAPMMAPMRKCVAASRMRLRRAQGRKQSHPMVQNVYSLLRRLAAAAARLNATRVLRAACSSPVACCGRSEGPALRLSLTVKCGRMENPFAATAIRLHPPQQSRPPRGKTP